MGFINVSSCPGYLLAVLASDMAFFFSLAVIEQLPMDLRDRFTEMREMDLQVQSRHRYNVTTSKHYHSPVPLVEKCLTLQLL